MRKIDKNITKNPRTGMQHIDIEIRLAAVFALASWAMACAAPQIDPMTPASASTLESKTLTYHPDLKAVAEKLPAGVGRPWLRGLLNAAFSVSGATQPFAPTQVVALDENVSVYVYRPGSGPAAPLPSLFWIHGGGFIMGDARSDAAFFKRVVEELGISVVSVQYRLAVKHPFPAPLDDCRRAYLWTRAQPWVDPKRLIIAGASAGGGLAAALVQRLHDDEEPLPKLQLLIYPMLDDRSSQGTSPADPMFRLWDRASNRYAWDCYLQGTEHATPPRFAVPARAKDLRGLTPAWIGVGSLDLFHAEDIAFARALEQADVPTTLVVVPGAYHGFDVADPDAPVSRRFCDAQLQAMKAKLDALKATALPH